MDNEFEPLRAGLSEKKILLDCSTKNEHIPDIKRCVLTIRDRTHSTFSGTPFLKIPDIMNIALVMPAAFWIPAFSAGDGVSLTLIQQSIATGIDV